MDDVDVESHSEDIVVFFFPSFMPHNGNVLVITSRDAARNKNTCMHVNNTTNTYNQLIRCNDCQQRHLLSP